jgi:hypothetical protein
MNSFYKILSQLHKIVILGGISFIFYANSAYALSSISTSKISKLIVHDSGDIIVQFSENVAANENCSISNRIVLKRSHGIFKELYAALLSSFHSQNYVTGAVNGCSTEWQSKGMPYLIRLDLSK